MLESILKNQNEFVDINSVLRGYFTERAFHLLAEKPRKVTIKMEDNLFCIEMKNYVIIERDVNHFEDVIKLHSLFI